MSTHEKIHLQYNKREIETDTRAIVEKEKSDTLILLCLHYIINIYIINIDRELCSGTEPKHITDRITN